MNNYAKLGAASIFCVCSVLLSGCGSGLAIGSTKPNFDADFTASTDIVFDRLSAKANVTRHADAWEFVFSEPQSLAGVTLKIGESALEGGLGTLAFEAEDNSEYAMMPEIIAESVVKLSKCTNEQIVQNDEILTCDTDFDGKAVTVTANARNGSLISLKCPYYKLSVNFSDVKPYTAPETSDITSE